MYIDAERRFQELEAQTKHLHDESRKYFDAINGMLQHQIDFSKAMTEIYKPISGRMSDPETLKAEGNPDGIHACEEYEVVVKDMQDTLAPELEMIETRIINPANELLDVIKVIRKTATKREHKKLDYDRHRTVLKKLEDKKDRSLKDEKAMYKAEGDVEVATQEFNYFNDLLKDELPRLFELEREFIQPLFQSFYYMQLNVFYTLHEKMQQCDIGYFDLTIDVEEAFYKKRGNVQEEAEALSITRFKTTGRPRPPKYGGAAKPQQLLEAGPTANTPRITYKPQSADAEVDPNPPPPYSPQPASPSLGNASNAQHALTAAAAAAAAAGKPKPPPPKPKPKKFAAASPVETVEALYDFEAQADGDLSFKIGDIIEIVKRTDNTNEWWTGKLQGKTGQFPGESRTSFFFFFFFGFFLCNFDA